MECFGDHYLSVCSFSLGHFGYPFWPLQTFFSVHRPIPVTHFHIQNQYYKLTKGRRSHDRMIYGFTTTYAISAYHHWCCGFESWSGRGVQYYVIKFVSDLRFSTGTPVSSTDKTDCHDIAEILLEVPLNTIKQTNKQCNLTIFISWICPNYYSLDITNQSIYLSTNQSINQK